MSKVTRKTWDADGLRRHTPSHAAQMVGYSRHNHVVVFTSAQSHHHPALGNHSNMCNCNTQQPHYRSWNELLQMQPPINIRQSDLHGTCMAQPHYCTGTPLSCLSPCAPCPLSLCSTPAHLKHFRHSMSQVGGWSGSP